MYKELVDLMERIENTLHSMDRHDESHEYRKGYNDSLKGNLYYIQRILINENIRNQKGKL